MHYYELEWTPDLEQIYNTMLTYYISLPSILDIEGEPRLPVIYSKIEEAYENPWNGHKQSLHLDRIQNPKDDIIEFKKLLDKYNLHNNLEFFHQCPGHEKITNGFMPHRHIPGGVTRSRTDDGKIIDRYTGTNPGEKNTFMPTVYMQLTFPFINSHLGETLWSATYNEPFETRRHFTEEEITGRYTLNKNPVLFDVMTWHEGRNETNDEDRLLFGIQSKFHSFEEGVNFFKEMNKC